MPGMLDQQGRRSSSQLFMLRMWPDDVDNDQLDWHGSVQHVQSGEVRYFRDWSTLIAFIEIVMQEMKVRDPGELPGGDGPNSQA